MPIQPINWINLLKPVGGPPGIAHDDILFWGKYSDISGGQMPNILGDDYLTVSGAAGSETYQCPNTQDYIDADSDNVWFLADEAQRVTATSDLIGFDLQRTPVKYENDSPYAIEEIVILKSGVTLNASEINSLHAYMKLPLFWSGTLNAFGILKGNRGSEQLLFPTIYDKFIDSDGVVLTSHDLYVGIVANQKWALLTNDFKILNNQAHDPTLGALTQVVTGSGTSNPDISVDLIIPDTDNYNGGIILRRAGSSQYYRIALRRVSGTLEIDVRKVAVVITAKEVTHIAGENTLRVIAASNLIDVYLNGVKEISALDISSDYVTEENHGLVSFLSSTPDKILFDNFKLI